MVNTIYTLKIIDYFPIIFRLKISNYNVIFKAVPKSTSSGVVTGSTGTGNMTGGGAAGSMTPMLSHQYIMGQGVPYAFQQPVYSYEELQLMQQRIPHMVSYFQLHYLFICWLKYNLLLK